MITHTKSVGCARHYIRSRHSVDDVILHHHSILFLQLVQSGIDLRKTSGKQLEDSHHSRCQLRTGTDSTIIFLQHEQRRTRVWVCGYFSPCSICVMLNCIALCVVNKRMHARFKSDRLHSTWVGRRQDQMNTMLKQETKKQTGWRRRCT